MAKTIDQTRAFFWVPVILAGIYGGLSEILWVLLYSRFTPVEATEVARQVAATVFPNLVDSPAAPILGIAIHVALALAIALAFTRLVWLPRRDPRTVYTFAGAVSALTVIWAINFLLLLPAVNPGFAVLMPYTVTLFSKMLFALAMACGLHLHYRAAPPTER